MDVKVLRGKFLLLINYPNFTWSHFCFNSYNMIYYINIYLKKSFRLFAQTVYYALTGELFITIFTISCGYITLYSKGDEGYLLISNIAFLSFLYLIMRGTAYV